MRLLLLAKVQRLIDLPFIDIFSTLFTSSESSTAAIRKPVENAPVNDITSPGVVCNVGLSPATETVTVAAGSTIGFKLEQGKTIYHKGPAAMYLGRAPGKAADWDGSGSSWFKVRPNLLIRSFALKRSLLEDCRMGSNLQSFRFHTFRKGQLQCHHSFVRSLGRGDSIKFLFEAIRLILMSF